MIRLIHKGKWHLMQDDQLFMIWFIGGIVLIVLEFILPGGIVFFLGLGATVVSLLLYTGLIDGWLQAFTTWFIGSLVLLFGLRGVVQKFVPAIVEKARTDEDLDAYNKRGEVCERIPAGGEGRIKFRGSTWLARNHNAEEALEVGREVRIVFRDNLVWIVEKVEEQ
ncbi:NfeD family protein [Proteobacteria bacterium 005FR1]|nr:NfeD family protein [Proteobacteria bacterium 005FR1]